MNKAKWYALKVIGGREKKALAALQLAIEKESLQSYVKELLIPSEKLYKQVEGKRYLAEQTLLPGYILVSADLQNNNLQHVLSSTSGVLGFLGTQLRGKTRVPVPLRPGEVDKLLRNVGNKGNSKLDTTERNFILGEAVRIIYGPFKSLKGSVDKILEEQKKLIVSVKIFKRDTPIEMSYGQVERLK